MVTFLATCIGFFLAVMAMSVGLIVAGRRLRGSCGGLSSGGSCSCSPAKRARCHVKSQVTHAEVPIPPDALRREANLPASLANRH